MSQLVMDKVAQYSADEVFAEQKTVPYFDESDVRLMLGGAPKTRDLVVYCRVSRAGQYLDIHRSEGTIRCDFSPQKDRSGPRITIASHRYNAGTLRR